MEYLTEFQLILLSGLSIIFCLITSITIGIAWLYWSPALNSCSRMNCGCILYGSSYVTAFAGGDITFCRLVTFCPLIPAAIVFGICIYYIWKLRKPGRTSANGFLRQSENGMQYAVHNRFNESPSRYSHSFTFLASIVFILMFIEACFILEGYLWTCREYKHHVGRYLNATGDLSAIINDRLPCSVMYDFLDYLQPDILIRRPGIRSIYYHRTERINTSAILQTSLLTSWANVIIWALIVIFIGICKFKKFR